MPVGTAGAVKAVTREHLARGGRADRARQHLPPDAAARRRAGAPSSAACTGSRAGAARSSPTAAASRSSAWPRCGSSPRRACASRATSTARAPAHAPSGRWRSRRTWAPTSSWPSTSARPGRRPRRRWRRRPRAPRAGPRAAAPPTRRPTRRCSASCRAGSTRTCAQRARAEIVALGFPGYAIGGLSVGEPTEERARVLDWLDPVLPEDKPRYLMGVGTPEDLIEGRGARRRHVRLRDAHAQRPQRPALHAPRQAVDPERPLPEGPAPARPRLRLPDLPGHEPRLPAPPAHERGDHGRWSWPPSTTCSSTLTPWGACGRVSVWADSKSSGVETPRHSSGPGRGGGRLLARGVPAGERGSPPEIEMKTERRWPIRATSFSSPAPPPGGEQSPLPSFILMGLIFAIFYFVLILPMKKKQRKLEEMVKTLKSGDKVIADLRHLRHHRGRGGRRLRPAHRREDQDQGPEERRGRPPGPPDTEKK